jgi:hypothetical protein
MLILELLKKKSKKRFKKLLTITLSVGIMKEEKF